jgi:hypothetical protein
MLENEVEDGFSSENIISELIEIGHNLSIKL